ncbi:MAG TPA: Nramp family divalent metal transporter [Candidatus Acidoferrales bacterium]|nr:Nramp family divalent metal transporter [Candidatus Acidoferrales bacterium]
MRWPAAISPRAANRIRVAAVLGVLGPGLVSGFADNDAGGITTYSLAGAQFGYDLLWVLLASQIVLFFTQEVGMRLGLATGQGLTGLARERFGVRWAAFLTLTMLVANLGSTVAEFAGTSAALGLFGVPTPVSALLAASVVILLLTRGSFSRVQYLFVAVGIGVSLAYLASALIARPDWGRAAVSLVIPHGSFSAAYWVAVVGTVGTTITPWGQSFIQSYVADKRLGPEDLVPERFDVGMGALLTNLIAGFIVVACAATLWTAGDRSIPDAAAAARALEPLAGPATMTLFAVGLLAASFLGLGVVPLTSAYAACEAFGWENGVDQRPREAPAFYGLLAFFVGFAALFVLIPGLPLIQVMFLAQVLNALLLPFVLIFVMLLAADRRIMGALASGRILLSIGWLGTALLIVLSLVLVWTSVIT